MAVISSDTFDPLRRYVGVRLQQGVPIVDADWNELDDIRKFEVRAFLKWFVGNGVPEGNDGFRIEGTGLDNDFVIRSGITGTPDGLSNVGRCLVDGMDVLITADIQFTQQLLHENNNPDSTLLAQSLNGGTITAMKPLSTDGTVVVYLDVWERLITPSEEPKLVFPGLGVESCARRKREWVVRIDTNIPTPPVAGHSYYALATITRRTNDPKVAPADVTDLREQRLLLPPTTLITDTLGTNPADYRHGLGRPTINLRAAINALLRGDLPGAPEAPIAPFQEYESPSRAFLFDNANGLIALWSSTRFSSTSQVVASRLDLNNISAGFASPLLVTTNTNIYHYSPQAVLLPNGDLLVTYVSYDPSANTSGLFYKRASLTGLNSASEQTVVTPASAYMDQPVVILSGDLVTFFYYKYSTPSSSDSWQYQRFRHATNTFVDTTGQSLTTATPRGGVLHAARDGSGNIWCVFSASVNNTNNITALQFTPSNGTTTNIASLIGAASGYPYAPFVVARSNGDIQVYWGEVTGLFTATFHNNTWGSASIVPNTGTGNYDPYAVEDVNGASWLFWTHLVNNQYVIVFMRNDPFTQSWGQLRQLTSPSYSSFTYNSLALVTSDNSLWSFWYDNRTGYYNLTYRRLITVL